jgi:hypothetical protein
VSSSRIPHGTGLAVERAPRLCFLVLVIPELALQVCPCRQLGGHAREPQRLAELLLDGAGHLRMVLEVLLGVLPPLADAVLLIGVLGPALVHEAALTGQVQQIAFARDTLTVHYIELL